RGLPYANCLEGRAAVLTDLDRYPEAINVLKQSLEIWSAMPAGQRDEFQAAVTERTLAYWMLVDRRFEDAARHFSHCSQVIRAIHGPEHHVIPYTRAGRAFALVQLGRTQGMESEATESLTLAERLGVVMPDGQRTFVRFAAGGVLAATGRLEDG